MNRKTELEKGRTHNKALKRNWGGHLPASSLSLYSTSGLRVDRWSVRKS